MRPTTMYLVTLSCGCKHTYPPTTHPFPGALLTCPEHGDVHSLQAERVTPETRARCEQ